MTDPKNTRTARATNRVMATNHRTNALAAMMHHAPPLVRRVPTVPQNRITPMMRQPGPPVPRALTAPSASRLPRVTAHRLARPMAMTIANHAATSPMANHARIVPRMQNRQAQNQPARAAHRRTPATPLRGWTANRPANRQASPAENSRASLAQSPAASHAALVPIAAQRAQNAKITH